MSNDDIKFNSNISDEERNEFNGFEDNLEDDIDELFNMSEDTDQIPSPDDISVSKKDLSKFKLDYLARKLFVQEFTKEFLSNTQKYDGVSRDQVRFLIRIYYVVQKIRIRINNQIEAYLKAHPKEKTDVWQHLYNQFYLLEKEIEKIVAIYYKLHPFKWFFEQTVGIGPILASLLMSNIDISRANTAGAIWRYAGLINEEWKPGQKRPWNSDLKTGCWKIGQSFIKFADHPNGVYGKIYKAQKDLYWDRNINGDHKNRAIQIATDRDMNKLQFGKLYYQGKVDPVLMRAELIRVENEKIRIKQLKAAAKLAGQKVPTIPAPSIVHDNVLAKDGKGLPMLPPAHIDAMASRYAVKMFLSHLYEKWREFEGLPLAEPYMIAIKNHTHKYEAPQVAPSNKSSRKTTYTKSTSRTTSRSASTKTYKSTSNPRSVTYDLINDAVNS